MEELSFVYNWNNKLNAKRFTTIREYNKGRFIEGKVFNVVLKRKGKEIEQKGNAKVVKSVVLPFNKISELMCSLDTGYSREGSIKIFKNMYKDFSEEKLFDYVLLSFVNDKTN